MPVKLECRQFEDPRFIKYILDQEKKSIMHIIISLWTFQEVGYFFEYLRGKNIAFLPVLMILKKL